MAVAIKYPVLLGFSLCLLWRPTLTLGDDGHCIWYDECGTHPSTNKPVNCLYDGPAKPFRTQSAYHAFKTMCPALDRGRQTATCCSDSQIENVNEQMDVPRQVFAGCPSCYLNFAEIFCRFSCSFNQSNFVYPNQTGSWVNPSTGDKETQVLSITFALTTDFANGMFNSCRRVVAPSFEGPAISILCGQEADKCTPQNWLNYMGDIGNQQTPFPIDFNITDQPYVNSGGYRLTPSNATMRPVQCKQCQPSQTPASQSPANPSTAYAFKRPLFRTEQVVIHRAGHHSPIIHDYPPPSNTNTSFSPIFDKDFLHQVLDLLLELKAVQAEYEGQTITLEDICYQPGPDPGCYVASLLSYFNESHSQLDRVVKDEWGFFTVADYLDHVLFCFRDPGVNNDTTALHESCLAPFGGAVIPSNVLAGYGETVTAGQRLHPITVHATPALPDYGCCGGHPDPFLLSYQNATELVLTFLVHNNNGDPQNAMAEAWETAFIEFLANYSQHQPNMTLSFSTGPQNLPRGPENLLQDPENLIQGLENLIQSPDTLPQGTDTLLRKTGKVYQERAGHDSSKDTGGPSPLPNRNIFGVRSNGGDPYAVHFSQNPADFGDGSDDGN